MSPRFTGKVVIVTGSSNGIGRETARLFAAEGAKVTVTGRNTKALMETVELLKSVGSSEDDIVQVIGDLRKTDVQKQLISETVDKFGKLDILVNNAGGLCPDMTGEVGFEQTSETYDYVMDLNVKAVLEVTKMAMPHLIKAQGEVVIVSSIASSPFSFPGYPYYAISKAAVDQLTRSLAGTYIHQGVRVNCVNPGAIDTTIGEKQGVTAEQKEEMYGVYKQRSMVPAGRVGEATEIAELIAFLADRSKSAYIVGQCIVIDGGATLLCPMFTFAIPEEKVAE